MVAERVSGELRWYGKRFDPDWAELRLIIISDVHYGNPLFSLAHFQRTLRFVADNENVYAFLNGDLLEAAVKGSPGNVYRQAIPPRDQRDEMLDLLLPIKGKILGMTTGNHEWRLARETDTDFSEDIAKALEVPYRPEGMALRLQVGKGSERHKDRPWPFTAYCTHGYGGARTKGAKMVKLERVAAYIEGDFFAMSHDHDVNVASQVTLKMETNNIRDDPYHAGLQTGLMTANVAKLIKTNAYLKWGDYSEMGGFAPVNLATPVIWLLTPRSKLWEQVPDKPGKEVKVLV